MTFFPIKLYQINIKLIEPTILFSLHQKKRINVNNFKKKLICWGAADQCMVLQPIIQRLGAQYDLLIDDTPGKTSPFPEVDLVPGKAAFEAWFKGRNSADYGF